VGETAKVEQFVIPRAADLDRWIAERFARHGGAATPSAVRRLGGLVGPHTRLLDQEIGKLALYAGGRSVDVPDIDLMVAAVREGSIFPAVDAVLERRTSRAIRLMHELLEEGASVQYLMSMLARQLRMTIVAQDMMNSRASVDDIGKRLGLKAGSYPLLKTMEQAGKFDFDYVARAHRRLLEADVAFKTGADERLGAELLIARLAAS
jgi:DNA polymerase-3 subunit delta